MMNAASLIAMVEAQAPEPTCGDAPAVSLGALHVEDADSAALIAHRHAWADLAGRTLEPNLFYEPGFAIPLLQHAVGANRLRFVLVWEDGGASGFSRLVGLFPLVLPRGLSRFAAIARGFAFNQIVCGVPLIDRDHPSEILEAVVTWLDTKAGCRALALKDIPADGPFHSALARFCEANGRQAARNIETLDGYRRAVLLRSDGGDDRVTSFASAKRRKEQARLSRRLSGLGVRTYTSARTPAEVAVAMERYLALEQSGWKGARGTALICDPALATFVRSMTRLKAEEGRCRIDSIEIDGHPVAMGIVLTARDRAYFWKIAFDERHASLSPGVQFTMELTQKLLADPAVASTDSCAVADHPMIDRLWPDRLAMTDIMIALRPGTDGGFRRCVRSERWRRAFRHRAKAAFLRLRRLRGG